jgi:hypothetical protein
MRNRAGTRTWVSVLFGNLCLFRMLAVSGFNEGKDDGGEIKMLTASVVKCLPPTL